MQAQKSKQQIMAPVSIKVLRTCKCPKGFVIDHEFKVTLK